MTDGFAKYGIDHLSASSLNRWRDNCALWVLAYLHGVRDTGPALWRGTAVEHALTWIMRGEPLERATARASDSFEEAAQGELNEENDAEKLLIPGMVAQAANWHEQSRYQLAATQLAVETRLEGISVPIIGYIDFTSLDGEPDLDLKTTKRLPSEPSPAHVRQVALYNLARGRPVRLLYVTDKKFQTFDVSQWDCDLAIDDLTAVARSLERFLTIAPNAAAALQMLPVPTDHFMFGPVAAEYLQYIKDGPKPSKILTAG
jgi:hypothetical protein